MKCKYHNEKDAEFVCEKCKRPICEECAVDIMGKKVCNSCANYLVFNNKPQKSDSFFEKFIFFCFALFPGAGQMYLGLFRRGIQLMLTFIAGITLAAYASLESFLPLVMIPTWFYSFFDSFYMRRKIRDGETVEDMEAYSYRIITDNKLYVGIALVIIGLLGMVNVLDFGDVLGQQARHFYFMAKRSLMPAIFILIGAVILWRSKNSEAKTEELE